MKVLGREVPPPPQPTLPHRLPFHLPLSPSHLPHSTSSISTAIVSPDVGRGAHVQYSSPNVRVSTEFRKPEHQRRHCASRVQSVIQQPQPSVIQSTALQTVQISKGNVILLKQPTNSVIQTAAGGHTLQAVQVLEGEADDSDPTRKRQILARRPSYRKILNDLGGGEISVVPASALQLAGQGEGLQTIAMTNTANAGGAIVHYAQGSDGQFIVPGSPGTVFATSDLSGLKIATTSSSSFPQGVVLATSASTVHASSADQMAEEASRKREIRLMKNREAAKECRAKKKEYIKCLESRVAVLENQNKALIEELKTLKALYCQNS